MKALWFALVFAPGVAIACGVLDPVEQRSRDRKDVAIQVDLATTLARQADTVLIGEVVAQDGEESSTVVVVDQVLKGTANKTVPINREGVAGLVVSCKASDGFRNTRVIPSRRYIFYFQGPLLLRAGWTTRTAADISLRREVRLVRAAKDT